MPKVRHSSDLYTGTYPMLQQKSRSKTTTHKRSNEDTSRSGQGTADTREVEPVRLFPVMMDLVTSAHIPLDATSDQSISALDHGSSSGSVYHFPFLLPPPFDLQSVSIRKNHAMLLSRSRFPHGCCAFPRVHMMEYIELFNTILRWAMVMWTFGRTFVSHGISMSPISTSMVVELPRIFTGQSA